MIDNKMQNTVFSFNSYTSLDLNRCDDMEGLDTMGKVQIHCKSPEGS